MAKVPPIKPTPAGTKIDRDKVRTALRRLSAESVCDMLDEAIDLLSPAKLAMLVGRYLDGKQLRPDAPGKKNLLGAVRAFDQASRRGEYYESFNVSSKNFMDRSKGTRAFIAECNRHLDRCVAQASKGDAAEICEALEIIFDLLRYIDEGHDDVIFFADEAGSWQVGVDWGNVLPSWFVCLSRTAQPAEYARRVVEVVEDSTSTVAASSWLRRGALRPLPSARPCGRGQPRAREADDDLAALVARRAELRLLT